MAKIAVPEKYLDHWRRPWTRKAKYSPGFRLWLHKKGRLSPHFTYSEAACKDGTQIPRHLRTKARNHAFNLERFRQELGGVSLPVMSWYRHPAYNRKIGGASKSQHMSAVATDFSRQTVDRIGRQKFFEVANRVFKNGGVGDYPSGSAHVDSRGYFARWTSF